MIKISTSQIIFFSVVLAVTTAGLASVWRVYFYQSPQEKSALELKNRGANLWPPFYPYDSLLDIVLARRFMPRSVNCKQLHIDAEFVRAMGHTGTINAVAFFDCSFEQNSLSELRLINGLKYIIMTGHHVTDEVVTSVPPIPMVIEFACADSPIGDRSVAHIAYCFPNLNDICLNDTKVTAKAWADIASLSRLNTLRLVGTDFDAESIRKLISHQCVHTLVTDQRLATDDFLKTIKSLKSVESVESIGETMLCWNEPEPKKHDEGVVIDIQCADDSNVEH